MNRHAFAIGFAVALSSACAQPPAKEARPAKADAPGAAAAPAAATEKAAHVFHGKVEIIDAAAKTMTVNGENVEGWMGPMMMQYHADKPEIFATLKKGDQITATVYDGDFTTLHEVHVEMK